MSEVNGRFHQNEGWAGDQAIARPRRCFPGVGITIIGLAGGSAAAVGTGAGAIVAAGLISIFFDQEQSGSQQAGAKPMWLFLPEQGSREAAVTELLPSNANGNSASELSCRTRQPLSNRLAGHASQVSIAPLFKPLLTMDQSCLLPRHITARTLLLIRL